MRKSFLLLAGAAAVLVSCSKTETVDKASTNKIGFTGAYIGNTVESRAVTENDQSNLSKFQVFGQYAKEETTVQIFNNVPVTKGEDGMWTYSGGDRVWLKDKSYVFAAYAPAKALSSPDVTNNGYLNIGSYTSDANHQYDLIYATQTAQGKETGNNTPVQFTFKHLLSWVRLSLVNSFSDEYEVTVSNISVSGILPTNTFTTSEEVTGTDKNGGYWNEATGETRAFNFATSDETIDAMNPKTYDMVVVPQTIGPVTVTFNVTVKEISTRQILVDNKSMTATLPTTNGNPSAWDMGNRYNYKATIDYTSVKLDVIEFELSEEGVTSWTNSGDIILDAQFSE
ncbi:MAG: fimbrillin family protein [Alistipes sp.]|uniref:fimbrillin family protein n=1 Tax=Alistipes sp. TaxID=1872444 RepID=UPI0025C01864|nr:fimbrillin family protein [Alistipes sp.]MCD8274958.1 fimbrillin family protein [Alistipes sp.]